MFLVEKPLASTSQEAEELIELAKKAEQNTFGVSKTVDLISDFFDSTKKF